MFDDKKFAEWVHSNGYTFADIARALGINEATLYRKRSGVSDFTRGEINSMIVLLGCEDPISIFFADERT